MAKLWEKGYELDGLVETFTVGDDYRLDRELVVADCAGSIAHAMMLESIGVLGSGELTGLVAELRRCADEASRGEFVINREDEDCHTAIEARLTDSLGDAGKKIHTGRSRNDQVLTAIRLVERSFLLDFTGALIALVRSLIETARIHRYTPMPGRTHLQAAMPSSVGLWAGAYAEQLADELIPADAIYRLIDRSPLGSAAGYGVPLPIDRKLTADLLGFAGVHRNVIAAANSRGELDAWLLSLVDHVAVVLSRFAEDLILYSLPEFGYFSLPDELCSGSSIMPQKKNPDVLELMRARSASISSFATQLVSVIRSMPSGYHRDLQETKEPTLKGMRSGLDLVRIAELTVRRLVVNPERLRAAFLPGIYATDAALEKVAGGMNFRDAYREVAAELDSLADRDPVVSLRSRTHIGTAVRPGLEELEAEVAAHEAAFGARREGVEAALAKLLGSAIPVYLGRFR